MKTFHRAGAAVLAVAAFLGTGPNSHVAVAATTCDVRNVTQETRGEHFETMVRAATDDDRLLVSGRCLVSNAPVNVDIVIRGIGPRSVLTARGRDRVLTILGGASVRLRHLTIANGRTHDGAGIWSKSPDLRLRDVVVRGNQAAEGAGILNLGMVRLIASRVVHNAARDAAGIYNLDIPGAPDATVILIDSRVSRNTARRRGGGIVNGSPGATDEAVLSLIRSSVRRNTAGVEAGGLYNHLDGAVALDTESSVTGNDPDDCVGTPAC